MLKDLHILLTVALLGTVLVMGNLISNMHTEIEDAERKLAQEQARTSNLLSKVDKQVRELRELEDSKDLLLTELHLKQNTINKYVGRQATVYAKPGLVERLEVRAMGKFFKEVEEDAK